MDLEPFSRINPCGFSGLEVTQLSELGAKPGIEQVATDLEAALQDELESGLPEPGAERVKALGRADIHPAAVVKHAAHPDRKQPPT
jgi:lipoate-protein ligase B